MKKVRMLSIVIFVAAVITYGLHNLNEWKNRDFGSPVIKVDGNSVTVSCTAGEEAMLEGVTAEDKKDGDVSDTLMIETMSNFIEKGRRQAIMEKVSGRRGGFALSEKNHQPFAEYLHKRMHPSGDGCPGRCCPGGLPLDHRPFRSGRQ